MKVFMSVLFSIIYFGSFCQYSNYYNINKTVDVNQKVNVSGQVNVNSNITTIDYGSLALANSQREKNRLENLKYSDQKEKDIYLSISSNPILAYDYGSQINDKVKDIGNFIKYSYQYVAPHKSLFVFAGSGRLENVSENGVTTEINFPSPIYNKNKIEVNVEKNSKMENLIVGQVNDNVTKEGKAYVHKKDIARATVWGNPGFVGTVIWEDDYQLTITDNYSSYTDDGIYLFAKVRYWGNKKEITFEQLEGRRYYLKRLVEKVISTAIIYDYKVDK